MDSPSVVKRSPMSNQARTAVCHFEDDVEFDTVEMQRRLIHCCYERDEDNNKYTVRGNRIDYQIDGKLWKQLFSSGVSLFIIDKTDQYPMTVSQTSLLTLVLNNMEKNRTQLHNTKVYFENKNKYDLRACNISIKHNYHDEMCQQYNVIKYIKGHFYTTGKDPYVMVNPVWEIQSNDEIYYLMLCDDNSKRTVKLCKESYDKVLEFEYDALGPNKHFRWSISTNGYAACRIPNVLQDKYGQQYIYMHQVILGFYGNGKGTGNGSVDHINRNKLDNTMINLRIASDAEQKKNQWGNIRGTKRERQLTACRLPDGITQDMMAQYVTYCEEPCENKQYFVVEFYFGDNRHRWTTIKSKRKQLSIYDKLKCANEYIRQLLAYTDNGTNEEKLLTFKYICPFKVHRASLYPNYVYCSKKHGKKCLIFERRINPSDRSIFIYHSVGNYHTHYDPTCNKLVRLDLVRTLPESYDVFEQLCLLNDDIRLKYPNIDLDLTPEIRELYPDREYMDILVKRQRDEERKKREEEEKQERLKLEQEQKKEEQQIRQIEVNNKRSERMRGENNWNYGKHFTEEHCKKISLATREITDEKILEVRAAFAEGKSVQQVKDLCGISRYYASGIKNNNIVLTTERVEDVKTFKTSDELYIEKRVATLDEYLLIIDDLCEDVLRPGLICEKINNKRFENNPDSKELSVDVVKNLKRTLKKGKLPIYHCEVDDETYNKYEEKVRIFAGIPTTELSNQSI